MTRQYTAKMLLKLGPLSMGSFIFYTCWHPAECKKVLDGLMDSKEITFTGKRNDLYCLR